MQNWRRLIGTTGLCLALLAPLPLSALEVQLPALLAQEEVAIPASTAVAGELVYQDLEGGFYAVAGYRLVGNQQEFSAHLGQQVVVFGSLLDEASIFMTKAIEVEKIALIEHSGQLTIVGELVYQELEGGFYSVAGYRLIGEQQELAANPGQYVIVTGQLTEDVSIYMTKAITVEHLLPVAAEEVLQIAGELVYEDLEGGFYAVAGYRLIGEAETFKPYLGQQVLAVGTASNEMSIFMTKAIDIVSLSHLTLPDAVANNDKPELRTVEATEGRPEKITIDGVTVSFGQGLVVKEGILMVPLRTVVDAAGGKVGWSSRTKTATVELPDRVATFIVGATESEMNQQGVYYFKQNLIAMAKAPEIIGDRLHISADALSSVLGFLATDAGDNVLALVTPSAEQTTPMPEPGDELEWETISGSIQQITTEGRTRILVEGEAMSNGEPMLIWLTVDGNTKVLWAASQGAASVTDLAVGQTIKVALSGPVLESYPAQGGASLVTILE